MGMIDSAQSAPPGSSAGQQPPMGGNPPPQPGKQSILKTDPEKAKLSVLTVANLVLHVLKQPGVAQGIAQQMKQQDPAHALGMATYKILEQILQQAPGKVDPSILPAIGAESLGAVAQGVAMFGGPPPSPQLIQGAMQVMLQQFMQDNGISQQDLQGAADPDQDGDSDQDSGQDDDQDQGGPQPPGPGETDQTGAQSE